MTIIDKDVRDKLLELYYEQQKSLPEISKEIGIPYTTLNVMMQNMGISRRTIKKATKLKWKQRKKVQKEVEKK